MAENKKSVILYCDIIHTVEELSDEEAGRLFKHYLRYINDLEPEAPDKITKIAFEPIKHQLKRDLVKWEKSLGQRSNAGINSAVAKFKNKILANMDNVDIDFEISYCKKKIVESGGVDEYFEKCLSILNGIKDNQIKPTSVNEPETSPTVNVNVTVNDNVIVNEESNTPVVDLKNSNLFRQPVIPTKEDVYRAFLSSGGTKEMADVFYDKNNSTNWFLRGSPIINFRNLLPSFISNWTKNEKNGKSTGANQDATEKFNTRLNHANRYG